jgi:nicotinate-nucleotide pyrophosphorylase (carboxylating)
MLNIDRIMLDNMNMEQIKQATKLVTGKIETEISGGITLENIDNYYDTGVDFISVGQLTHSAKAFDYSLLID